MAEYAVGSFKFKREHPLALGSRSVVYKGTRQREEVAIQRIEIDFADIELEDLLRVTSHHHVAAYLGVEKDTDFNYIISELCPYSLVDYLSQGYQGPRFEHRKILAEVTQGLNFFHHLGLVHRQIKPSNILISKHERIKLRVSHLAIKWKKPSQHRDSFARTNRWVAPEVNKNAQSYSSASDIFDLGCLFNYVLCGEHPFGEPAERQINIDKMLFRLPQDDSCDSRAIVLITKMINGDRNGRPTAAEVLTDPFLQQRPLTNFVPHLSSCSEIGRGSYGTKVYEYLWKGITVAIKKIEKLHVVDYKKELEVLQNRLTLQSPHLIHYYNHAEDGKYCYIFMELCESNVQKLIDGRRYWPQRSFLKQIVAGLEHLHAMSIIHRDIKPSNVLVTRDIRNTWIPKLADFGISKTAGHEGRDETVSCKGSPGWTAPELCGIGPVEYSKSVDIFAAGCLLYFIWTRGKHPFQGTVPQQNLNLDDCHYNIQKYGRQESELVLSSIDADLRDLVERMIERQPSRRVTTTDALSHPAFWRAEEALQYIVKAVDGKLKPEKVRDKRAIGSSQLINLLESTSDTITGKNWKAKLSLSVQGAIDVGQGGRPKNPPYNGSSVYDLLLCIRDKHTHFNELKEEVRKELGITDSDYWKTWSTKFPQLLVHTWQALEGKVTTPPSTPTRKAKASKFRTTKSTSSNLRVQAESQLDEPPVASKSDSTLDTAHWRPFSSPQSGNAAQRRAFSPRNSSRVETPTNGGPDHVNSGSASDAGWKRSPPGGKQTGLSTSTKATHELQETTCVNMADLVKKSEILEKGPPSIYLLPTTSRTDGSQSRWIDIGKRSGRAQHKTIFLIGIANSGKSILLNAIVNYIYGVKWNSPYRFAVTKADESTQSITVLTIHHERDLQIPFSLTVVDVPEKMGTTPIRDFLLKSDNKLSAFNALYLAIQPEGTLKEDEVKFLHSLCRTFDVDGQENRPGLIVTSSTRKSSSNREPRIVQICRESDRIPVAKDKASRVQFYYVNSCWLWRWNDIGNVFGVSSYEEHWKVWHSQLKKLFDDLASLPDQRMKAIRERIQSATRNVPTSPVFKKKQLDAQCEMHEFAYNCEQCESTCRIFKVHGSSLPNLNSISCQCSCTSDKHKLEITQLKNDGTKGKFKESRDPEWLPTARNFRHNWANRML